MYSKPFSFSGTRVSMGGSSSPASRSRLLAWERNLLNPWSSSTAELQFGTFSSSFCFSKKSWISDPKAERLSRDSSSTSRATRRSGAKTHTNAALMRRRVEAGLATGKRVPRVRGGHCSAESGCDSSSSRLLKELLLSSSAREGACRRSNAKQSPSSCGRSLSSFFSGCGADVWNGTHQMSDLTVERRSDWTWFIIFLKNFDLVYKSDGTSISILKFRYNIGLKCRFGLGTDRTRFLISSLDLFYVYSDTCDVEWYDIHHQDHVHNQITPTSNLWGFKNKFDYSQNVSI